MKEGPFVTDLMTLKKLTTILKTNSNLKIRGIVITAYDGRSNEAKKQLDAFRMKAAEIGTEVLEPPIRATSKVGDAQRKKINLLDFKPNDNTAADDYKQVIKVLLNE